MRGVRWRRKQNQYEPWNRHNLPLLVSPCAQACVWLLVIHVRWAKKPKLMKKRCSKTLMRRDFFVSRSCSLLSSPLSSPEWSCFFSGSESLMGMKKNVRSYPEDLLDFVMEPRHRGPNFWSSALPQRMKFFRKWNSEIWQNARSTRPRKHERRRDCWGRCRSTYSSSLSWLQELARRRRHSFALWWGSHIEMPIIHESLLFYRWTIDEDGR